MIATRTRVILGAEQIGKILRLYPFVNQSSPVEEQRSLLFEVAETGVVTVTACCMTATAQYAFQTGDGTFIPGNFLYPMSEIVKFAPQESIVIEAETDPDGYCVPQTSFKDQFGTLDMSTVRAGSLQRFRCHTMPARENIVASYELGTPEFARAAVRLSAIVDGTDANQPLHHCYFFPDYDTKTLLLVGTSSDGRSLGMSTMAVADGRPVPFLVQSDVLVRTVKSLGTPAPETIPVYLCDNGIGLFRLSDYVVLFQLGPGEFVFPDRDNPANALTFFEIYQRFRPDKKVSQEAAITRQPLAEALTKRMQEHMRIGNAEPGVLLELTWCRLRLFDFGGQHPFADFGIDYEGPDVQLLFKLPKFAKLVNCLVFNHFKLRFNNGGMVEFMDIPDSGGMPEFKSLMARTRVQ